MNKPSDVSTISVNRHEKMEAFKSKSLWHPTTTEACDENNIFFPLYIRRKKKGKRNEKETFFFFFHLGKYIKQLIGKCVGELSRHINTH